MKLTLKGAKKKADKAWSLAIRRKNGGRCEICNSRPGNNPHHVVGRRNYTLRFNQRNGVLLCSYHHTFGRDSAHQNSVWFLEWFKKTRPADFEHVRSVKNRIIKRTIKDYVKIAEELSHDEKTNH